MPNKEWHPLFVTSLKEALSDAGPGEVDIQAEVALSSKPLDIDVLVVKKSGDARLRHPLAGIFRTYNLFEFKSPGDHLGPNDFDKGMAIAYLYKAIEHRKALTLESFTVTFASRRRPRAMLDMIRKRGLAVLENKPAPGFYRIEGGPMPIQAVVLKELQNAEESYMFSTFMTGSEKIRVAATALLLKKHLEDPANPHRRELLEFKFRNQLVTPEEMEEVLKMRSQMAEKNRAQMEAFLRNHPAIQEISARISVESEARGKASGEIKAKRDAICKYLTRKFGTKSTGLQEKIQQVTKLEVLDRTLDRLFTADTFEEARAIILDENGKPVQ